MNRLRIGSGPRAGEVIDLTSGSLTIGRDGGASTVAFEAEGLATVHFRIAAVKGGGFGIQDLGSPSGTLVNGKRVSAQRLSPGDRIAAGALALTFESDETVLRATSSSTANALTASASMRDTAAAAPAVKAATYETPTGSAARASDPDLTGKALGGYQIEKVLGRGGMGTVYKATQTSLHRTVALKVLSPALARDPKFVEMFLREARAAAQLHHPNVVTIFDVGSDGETHYFSMEVFEGGSIEQILRREKKLDVARALAATRDAAAALDFAESRKILHRDVKPDNLMVSAHGVVKLADLGLAVRRGEATAARIGTPHFLAPECIRGGAADHRSDLYSLGATLFRMLTGRTPIQGATVSEILENAATKEPALLRTLDAAIPEPVEALVARLLQKDPAKRPANAKEVLTAIDAITGGAPAGSSSTKKLAVILAVAAAAVLGGVLFFKNSEPETNRTTVVRDTETETRLQREKEQKERELREKDAELALARIPDKLAVSEHVQRLEAVMKNYAGTPAAVKAREEADRVRAEELARVERERVKSTAVAEYRVNLEKRIQDSLTAGKFAEALAAPKGLDGFSTAVEDPDAKAAIDIVPERVTAAAETKAKEQMNRALELRSQGKLDEAKAEYEKLAASLRELAAAPREEVGEARLYRVQTYLTSVEGALKELEKGRVEVVQRHSAAARAAAAVTLRGALEGARAGKAATVSSLAAIDASAVGDADAKALLAETQLDARAYATYLTRLEEANVTKDFGSEPFVDPLTSKPARIVGFDDAGLHVEAKPGAAPTTVPFDKLGAVRVCQLFSRLTAKTPEDALLLARASLFAACAFDTGRLADYMRGLKLDAPGVDAPPDAGDDGFQAALDRIPAGAEAPAAEALRRRAEGERSAARKLREGLTAFAAARYAEAERLLGEFVASSRGTAAALLVSSSARGPSGSAAPPR